MGKILPVLLVIIGIGAGIGAGLFLRPDPSHKVTENECVEIAADGSQEHDPKFDDSKASEEDALREYVKLNNQFVVPVVSKDLVDSLVVMSLSVEVTEGQSSAIYAREPKLRDAFLQVLFDHANIGGFQGEFTNSNNMDILRVALTETAKGIIGDVVLSVLITDIARQDV